MWVTGRGSRGALCQWLPVPWVSPGLRPASCPPGSLVLVEQPVPCRFQGREGGRMLWAEVPRRRCWVSSPSGRSHTGPPSFAWTPCAACRLFCSSLFTSQGEEERHHDLEASGGPYPLTQSVEPGCMRPVWLRWLLGSGAGQAGEAPRLPTLTLKSSRAPLLFLCTETGDLGQGIRSRSQSKGLGVARGACDMGGPRGPLAGCDPAQRNPINTKSKMLPMELPWRLFSLRLFSLRPEAQPPVCRQEKQVTRRGYPLPTSEVPFPLLPLVPSLYF